MRRGIFVSFVDPREFRILPALPAFFDLPLATPRLSEDALDRLRKDCFCGFAARTADERRIQQDLLPLHEIGRPQMLLVREA